MLKRFFLLIIVLILSLFVVKTPLYSQEPPVEETKLSFDQVYAEYVGSIDEYNMAHEEYVLKRSQHLKFDTLESTQKAFDATLLMLQKRDDVAVSYLKVVRKKLEEGKGITDSKKESLYLRIDEEIAWYLNHRDNLTTTGSLDDLVSDSNIAKGRWLLVDPLVYEVMSLLSQGKITKFSERLDEVHEGIKEKLEEIRSDEREGYSFSPSKFDTLDRWMFEVDGRIVRSKEKQAEADTIIEEMVNARRDRVRYPSSYNTLISKLTEAQLYMKEANKHIQEIIRQIKIED